MHTAPGCLTAACSQPAAVADCSQHWLFSRCCAQAVNASIPMQERMWSVLTPNASLWASQDVVQQTSWSAGHLVYEPCLPAAAPVAGCNGLVVLFLLQMCTDGVGCKRRVCFFAHAENELRKPEEDPVWLQQQMQAEMAAGKGQGCSCNMAVGKTQTCHVGQQYRASDNLPMRDCCVHAIMSCQSLLLCMTPAAPISCLLLQSNKLSSLRH